MKLHVLAISKDTRFNLETINFYTEFETFKLYLFTLFSLQGLCVNTLERTRALNLIEKVLLSLTRKKTVLSWEGAQVLWRISADDQELRGMCFY